MHKNCKGTIDIGKKIQITLISGMMIHKTYKCELLLKKFYLLYQLVYWENLI